MAYLCVCAYDVPVRVVSGYVLSSLSCGGCASSYGGLGSFTCCSVISRSSWRYKIECNNMHGERVNTYLVVQKLY